MKDENGRIYWLDELSGQVWTPMRLDFEKRRLMALEEEVKASKKLIQQIEEVKRHDGKEEHRRAKKAIPRSKKRAAG